MKKNQPSPWAALVTLALLAVLVAGCPNPSAPTVTATPYRPDDGDGPLTDAPLPPTSTPLSPKVTPLPTPSPTAAPPTPAPAPEIASYSRAAWGLTFSYPASWKVLQETDQQVTLIHQGDLTMFLVRFEAAELGFSPEVLKSLLEDFAGPAGDVEIGEAHARPIAGQDAAATRLTATIEGVEMSGPIAVLSHPETGSSFVLLAWTLRALAGQQQPTFDAIFESVDFFPPEPPPATAEGDSQGGLQIINARHYTDLGGTLHVVGEVQNNSGEPVEDVDVLVRLYASDGAMLTDERWSLPVNLIPAGDRAPFEVLFTHAPDNWATYDLEAGGEPADFMLRYTYGELEIAEHRGQVPDFGDYEISGLVRNVGDKDAKFVQVTATLYDGEGTVVGVDYTFVEADVMQAGGLSAFEITVFGVAAPVDSYRLLVEGTEAG